MCRWPCKWRGSLGFDALAASAAVDAARRPRFVPLDGQVDAALMQDHRPAARLDVGRDVGGVAELGDNVIRNRRGEPSGQYHRRVASRTNLPAASARVSATARTSQVITLRFS
jgi:hypothetical protein